MKKSIISLFLCLVVILGIAQTTAFAATEPQQDTDGTYLIGTADELKWFAEYVNKGNNTVNAKLTKDIDLSTVCGSNNTGSWTPIGKSGTQRYKGTFDGDGHIVKNLYIYTEGIDSENTYLGLFSDIGYGGKIKNLGVEGQITAENFNSAIGGIVGYLEKNGSVENCYSAVKIVGGNSSVGGIAGGTQMDSSITNCYNVGEVSGKAKVAGIAGNGEYSTIENCYSAGTVTAVGSNTKAAAITYGEKVSTSSGVQNCYYLENILVVNGIGGNNIAFRKQKTEEELKGLASTLGSAYKADTGNVNNGYPLLTWQRETRVIEVSEITLDKYTLDITCSDKEIQLTVTVKPDDATDKTVTWVSNHEDVVTVDENGKITVVGVGEASVTAKVGEKKKVCNITVSHDWGETEYQWNDDHSSCCAKRTCKGNATHISTADSESVSSSVKKAPTCTEMGDTEYIAKFSSEVDWAENQTKVVTDIDELGHDHSGKWIKDNKNHWKICNRDGCDEIIDLEKHSYKFNICETCHYIKYNTVTSDKTDTKDDVVETNPNTGAPVISGIGTIAVLCAVIAVLKK